ncbi:probable pectinesterase 29 [Ricinus communis]|uniref:pectinesterase n=1 Tax=Ricinus communis TaxID=3988 RepID=B9RNB6_RICCO|nr:probable pectinesterase 29 [Ricinus communis]EEF47239.1 Pectinesterase-2 precursor, putative [Ricinus communis]|eukprot:XP_002515255.1 probable pectinesterase 29 [Ricinus communis]
MHHLSSSLFIWVLLSPLSFSGCCKALDCSSNESNQNQVAHTIFVDKSGRGNFTTIQSAVDSIPKNNSRWIRVLISNDKYLEKVAIPANKPCIFLQGAGKNTSIEWDDHEDKPTSAIFISLADNIVAKSITFKNTYNLRSPNMVWRRATAIKIGGDKSAFYGCSFVGIQDTLYDCKGRHYFNKCYIEGAMDFIHGAAQSIYEESTVSVNIGNYEPGLTGCITAQKKEFPEQRSGFVFKNCKITGTGKVLLGRAWGAYSTVVIYNSTISDVVVPDGWNAWHGVGHEGNLTYVEANNTGPGADTSKRVPWLKKLDAVQLSQFVNLSFIDADGWIAKLP